MKKFLTLALALVMVLAFAAPAMAFTSDAVEDVEYDLSLELVEYDDNDFFGIASAAPSDRGYAKNEIVAFVAALAIPKNADIDDYTKIEFTGENVNFNVTDNKTNFATANLVGADRKVKYDADGIYGTLTADDYEGKTTLKWLGFAKVTGDEASITATVYASDVEDAEFVAVNDAEYGYYVWELFLTLDDEDFRIVCDEQRGKADGLVYYDVYSEDFGMPLFSIETNSKGVTKNLYILNEEMYKVEKNSRGQLLFISDNGDDMVVKGDPMYKILSKIYEDYFVEIFGLDFDNIGNKLKMSFFEDLASYDSFSVTIDIEPWTAYVQIPDVVVVDPPKTGDAITLVGFVMIIAALAGVVVFKKVRA